MYPQIHWELVADHLRPAEHSLGIAGLGDRTDFVGTCGTCSEKKSCTWIERVQLIRTIQRLDSSCTNRCLLRMSN
jgi:hypothetical protein